MDEVNDVGLLPALVLLASVGVGILVFGSGVNVPPYMTSFSSEVWTSKVFFGFSVFLLMVNIFAMGEFLARRLGLTAQGAKLRLLREKDNTSGINWKVVAKAAGLGAILGLVFWGGTYQFTKESLLETGLIWCLVVILEFAVLAALLTVRFELWNRIATLFTEERIRIDPMPVVPETLVLGSTGDETLEHGRKANWASINKRALTGSILISGSLGSGKTQGTILPYLDQLLKNFKKTPSVLAIDPKRMFIKNAVQIFAKRGLQSNVLRMTLDGDVTMNPVYVEKPLKNSRFMSVAEMVRASAINISGRSSDSAFWEESSFMLLKNCVVFCAATLRYFTLKDIYESIVKAISDPLHDELYKVLDEDLKLEPAHRKFDEEERFNISCGITYFEDEYSRLEERVKTGILATSTVFLNYFQEFRANRIFCPNEEARTIVSMDQIIDDGLSLLLDIDNPPLAKAMGTFIKLHFEQSVLNRLASSRPNLDRLAAIIVDEYQDVVTCGGGNGLGDERFLAKSREANGVMIAATQSITSLLNSVGREKAARELIQNFRTRIACHSSDIETIKQFQELVGPIDVERNSHSVSETSQQAKRNILLGGFDSKNSSISESYSVSQHRENEVTGRDFTNLKTFEALALVYDGFETKFTKLFLKPYFLKSKNLLQGEVLKRLKEFDLGIVTRPAIVTLLVTLAWQAAFAIPNICSVVNTPMFRSCLEWQVTPATCGVPPRPCSRITYYVPQTFFEVTTSRGFSHFSTMPGVAGQLSSSIPGAYGALDDEGAQSYQAHSMSIPYASMALSGLPCGGARSPKMCLDVASEHFGRHWDTGSSDVSQPAFLAWQAAPKLCFLKGAVKSVSTLVAGDSAMCSLKVDLKVPFPPSQMPVCTNWGVMFPRYSTISGPSELTSALAVASRIKSLGVEVMQSVPADLDEKWQLISPNSSSCFREFENVGALESIKLVNNRGRLVGKEMQGNLVATWKKVSCLKDTALVPYYEAQVGILQAACVGF